MELFLAILMVLGIFVVVPSIIGFTIVAVYSGLFRVVFDKMQKRVATNLVKVRRVYQTIISHGRAVPATEEPATERAI